LKVDIEGSGHSPSPRYHYLNIRKLANDINLGLEGDKYPRGNIRGEISYTKTEGGQQTFNGDGNSLPQYQNMKLAHLCVKVVVVIISDN